MSFLSIFTPQGEISPCASSADVKDGFAHTKDSASSSSSSSRSKKKKKRDADDHVPLLLLLLLLPPPPLPSTFWPGRNFPYLSWKHGGKKEEGVGQKNSCLAFGRTDGEEKNRLWHIFGVPRLLSSLLPSRKRGGRREGATSCLPPLSFPFCFWRKGEAHHYLSSFFV